MTPDKTRTPRSGRMRRLAEELAEEGFEVAGFEADSATLLAELDYALRPNVHERRIPSYGAIVSPRCESFRWEEPTQLSITCRGMGGLALSDARSFADGISSWLVRPSSGEDELVVFDRSAASERDLVVLAAATRGALVQRHPSGLVRIVGDFGVLRWDGIGWHHEPPVGTWIDAVGLCSERGDRDILTRLLEFAVHDLGSRGVGAILIYRALPEPGPGVQTRLAVPPPLRIDRPTDLAPLRHVLAQVDGAAVFDASGTLQQLGVRLVPSPEAESGVEAYRGMRHTSGRRYSFDDPMSTVIVVSEDGPVTVLRNGEMLGRSEPT